VAALVAALVVASGVALAIGRPTSGHPGLTPQAAPTTAATAASPTTTGPPPTDAATVAVTTPAAPLPLPVAVPAGPPPQAGCPPAPPPPSTGGGHVTPPWHPALEVPDADLPRAAPPAPWAADLGAIDGKGMWVWQVPKTEGGDVDAIVRHAVAAGLHQLWVRVGDSQDGFYAVQTLDALVPAAHRAGIAVIGWGFPYLYDPVGDAIWTLDALRWTGPAGARLDGYSADIERPSEGVDLSAARVAAYLGTVRAGAGNRLIVATVYPPTNGNWFGTYPYHAMAPYVDAFAPMVYWECTDPGADAAQAIGRLSSLRPVHVIGQAFSLADVGGRVPAPSAAETEWFLATAERGGARGASFWVWQSATAEEWHALAAYPWPG